MKRLSILITLSFMFSAFTATPTHSANLFIDPASPLVQVGGEITICVNNPSGEVKWYAFEGEIEKTGNSVKYKAPDYVAIDVVTVKDSAGNSGTVTVVVQEKEKIDERFSKENANWEIFTNRDNIQALLLSDDEKYLWVGTNGGLEKRDAATGQIIQIFTNLDGLPDNYITALISDNNGGLWIGTKNGGLAHFKSNSTWKNFNENNSQLPVNYVLSLLSDGNDGIWIGTWGGGLIHLTVPNDWYEAFGGGIWNIFNMDNSTLSSNWIKSLLSDGEGGLWIGSWAGRLIHFKADETCEEFSYPTSGNLSSIVSDNQGGLWILITGDSRTDMFAHFKSDNTWETFNYKSGLPLTSFTSILSDYKGGVWIGTWDGLVHFKSDRTLELFNSDNSGLPSNFLSSLLSDGNGGIWIGTDGGDLALLKSDGTWSISPKNEFILPSNTVTDILLDNAGGMWIGTWGGGLARFKSDRTWEVFNTDNSELSSNYVSSLLSDGNGGLWIGTESGYEYNGETLGPLAHLKSDGTWEIFNTMNSELSSDYVTCIVSDGNGGLWIGTRIDGVIHFKSNKTWEIFNTDNSKIPSNGVNALLSDSNNGVWIGTEAKYVDFGKTSSGGLAHLKSEGTWEIFDTTNSKLSSNFVNTLISDGNGGLWIGTGDWWGGGGVDHLEPDGTLKKYIITSNWVLSLLSDGNGGLWIGTGDEENSIWSGLVHFKADQTWEAYHNINSKLPNNRIYSILSDDSGGLLIGTGAGLAYLTFSSSNIQDEQYLKNGRAAIIIAGGGNTDDNALWDSTAKISNYAYKMLNKRGFLNTDIHYISPQPFADFNGDGIDDKIVDSPNPARQIQLSDIQAAFDWAKTKGTLNQPLYIFFTDHGGDGKLQLAKGVYIEASELKTMLDDYQKTTGNKVVFVIDACHSGTMVKALAGENRAIISSTDDGVAYFDRLNGQSFIWYVTKGLNKGMNFNEAFYYASSEYKKALGKVSQYESISAGSDTLNLTQEPQFDDNGDGLYNISVDGNWLKTVSVNGTWSNADVTLTVEAVTQSGTILNSNTQTILKAKATLANGRVTRAWAVIRPPKMDILFDSTTGTPILAFPKVDLSQSTTEGEENIYQGSWNGFVYNGEYEITFYAEDNDKNIESSESIILTVADGLACPEKGSLKVGIDKQPDSTGQITYKSGDTLKISVTENLAYGYDLYAALLMPDGNFTAFKSPLTDANISYLQKENFNKLYWGDRWIDTNRNINMGRSVDVVDLTLPQEKLPSGQYCVYAALIPEGQDLMVSAGKGLIVLDEVCFEVGK